MAGLTPIWFYATVENIEDPLDSGRVQVRVHSIHNPDKNILPTKYLPWATVMVPAVSAATSDGVGRSPTGLTVGSEVMGISMDDGYSDLRVLFTWYAKGEVSLLARGSVDAVVQTHDSNVISNVQITKSDFINEPITDRTSSKYPYNDVDVYRSGFRIENDGSDGCRRMELHPKNSYKEWQQDGSLIERAKMFFKVCKESFVTIVEGTWIDQCASNFVQRIAGNFYSEVAGQWTISCPSTLIKTDAFEVDSPLVQVSGKMKVGGPFYVSEMYVGTIHCDNVTYSQKIEKGTGGGDTRPDMSLSDNGGNYPATPSLVENKALPLQYEVNGTSGAGLATYWTGNGLDEVNKISSSTAMTIYKAAFDIGSITDGWGIVQRALNAMNRMGRDWPDLPITNKKDEATIAALNAAIKKRGAVHVDNCINGTTAAFYIQKAEASADYKKTFREKISKNISYLKQNRATGENDDVQPTI